MSEARRKPRALLIDIDGTLTECPDYTLLSWYMTSKGMGARVEDHAELHRQFKAGEFSAEVFMERLTDLWVATGNANYGFMVNMFKSWELRKDAKETIEQLLDCDIRLCLISSAMDLYVKTVAEILGIEDWIANARLEFDEQGNLLRIIYDPNESELKGAQFDVYAEEHGLTVEDCLMLGNEPLKNDRIMFERLKGSIAIGIESNEETRALAPHIINSLSQVPAIVGC